MSFQESSEDPFSNTELSDKLFQSKIDLSSTESDDDNYLTSSEDNDIEWEDLNLSPMDAQAEMENAKKEDIETTIDCKILVNSQKKRRGITYNDRKLRLEIHKLHLLCLISHAFLRNNFCRDKRLHTTLKSILPHEVQRLFNPDTRISQYLKSKMFMSALKASVSIWKKKFTKNKYGLSKPIWTNSNQPNKVQNEKQYDNISSFHDFLKAAEQLQGSRDLGAQLFVALLRTNNVNTRLTVLLQPFPYRFGDSDSVQNLSLNTFDKNNDISKLEDNHINKNTLKRHCSSGSLNNLNSVGLIRASKLPRINYFVKNNSSNLLNNLDNIKESFHPTYWAEALNPSTQKWIFVDPMVSCLVGKPSKMESLILKSKNSLSYIISFDGNGVVKDVTRRYTKYFNSKIRKQRLESVVGGEKWWERVLNFYRLGYVKQNYDKIEDEEFLERQAFEKIPKTIKDLKDHPIYVIERHLKREQIIFPKKPCSFIITKKKGIQIKEPVFYRKNIITVLPSIKWYQRGRNIKFGEQPMKIVPKNKGITFQHETDNTIKNIMIGLYSESQTELYLPPPVINGKVPKNAYGNLDIFVPSMIPEGAVHLPFPGICKVAKILDVDYADAVVGFKFKKRTSLPIIKGIVIAKEFEEAVSLAFRIMEEEKNELISQKIKNIILAKWRLFYKKLCIYERLKQYDIKNVDTV